MSILEAKHSSRNPESQSIEFHSIHNCGHAAEELRNIETYGRASNYLSLGMIYLQENPLLVEELRPEHIKNRLLGHWGSIPGSSVVTALLRRPDRFTKVASLVTGSHMHVARPSTNLD